MNGKEVSSIFNTSWESVYRSVTWVVEYGLERRSLAGVTAIGVDEVPFQKGHRYLTVVYPSGMRIPGRARCNCFSGK